MRKILFLTILGLFIATTCHSKTEKEYVASWCTLAAGQTEIRLYDKTRCDCLTATHAIEFDFGKKWAESIGQSLHYALQTGKKAGIVLILRSKSDRKNWLKLNSVIQHYRLPIDTWSIEDF